MAVKSGFKILIMRSCLFPIYFATMSDTLFGTIPGGFFHSKRGGLWILLLLYERLSWGRGIPLDPLANCKCISNSMVDIVLNKLESSICIGVINILILGLIVSMVVDGLVDLS